MKYKTVLRWVGAGILAAVILIGALFFVQKQQEAAKLEQLKRATTARELLLAHFGGTHIFSEDVPEYLLGRYIDENCKLRILLHDSARDEEAAIRESLGEYADMAEFAYVAVTAGELQVRAADIEALMKQQGYADAKAFVNKRTGNIEIYLYMPGEAVAEAEAWVREQTAYPFDDVGIQYTFFYWEEVPFLPGSQQAKDELVKCLQAAGGYNVYKEYYSGCYVGQDKKLHIVMKEGITREQRKRLEACLRDYSDITVYEYGGYSEEALWVYLDELRDITDAMGIMLTGYSVDTKLGLPNISVLPEDFPLLQILLESDAAPLLNGEKIPAICFLRGISYSANG